MGPLALWDHGWFGPRTARRIAYCDRVTDLLIDLATAGVGGRAIEASDEFFAPKERLVHDDDPVAEPTRVTDRGRWTDGWVTRRRREQGHEWAIVRLGLPGILRQVLVDTSHVTVDAPEGVSLEAAHFEGDPHIVDLIRSRTKWSEVITHSAITPDGQNVFGVSLGTPVTHVRLVAYPDGGIARLRCFGEPVPRPGLLDGSTEVDLAAVAHGGRVVDSSHRAGNPNVLLRRSDARNAGDVWETPRRRGPGNDWAVVRLAGPGRLNRIVIDTSAVTGNLPAAISVEGVHAPGISSDDLWNADWIPVVDESDVDPNRAHAFEDLPSTEMTHLRLNVHPDGAIARFRAFGVAQRGWHEA
jgi:allantoicase